MVDFGRVLTAMVTPFHPDGSVNYEVAAKLAAHLVAHGTDTLVVCGTTGESPTLTLEEECKLFSVLKSTLGDQAKIIAGTGSNSTHEAIAATQKASEFGLDGSLQVVPYYNKPPQEGLYQHFRAIATAVPDLPIMLYNVPGRTGQNLQADTVARLAELPNIVAIKEASGNLEQAVLIRRKTPTEFRIYSGDDSLTLPLLSIGGTGVVSVASHLVGDRLQAMVQHFEQGSVQKAADLNAELFPLFKALFATTNPIPVKTALNLLGWNVGSTRLPLVSPDFDVQHRLKEVMVELRLIT